MDHLAFHPGPLPPDLVGCAGLRHPSYGAIASFVGVVRNHHHGRTVTALHYQAHPELGIGVLRRLADQLRADHDSGLVATIVHATGDLVPGDAAIAIHLRAAHRRAALAACDQAIEAIKRDLPVWKRETYADGTTVWMEGS